MAAYALIRGVGVIPFVRDYRGRRGNPAAKDPAAEKELAPPVAGSGLRVLPHAGGIRRGRGCITLQIA